ncbi:hypothetical protein F5Y13DRAFT_203203 [Hypoxylon sp. FL1857]|nr:hypothetical protein F5Y13DRAFT_203203 [Hypoxylon sp. FL1857]
MASSHGIKRQEDNSGGQRGTGLTPGGYQQFPPPEALPEYVNRALPPRPTDSSSSSSYDYPDKGTQQQPTLNYQSLVGQHSDIPALVFNEAGPSMAQPPEVVVPSAPELREQQLEIASPQPRYPARMILETRVREHDIVSPVSAPLTGNNIHQQHQVSPLSPSESECSLHSMISEYTNRHSSSEKEEPDLSNVEGRHFVYDGKHTAHSSGDLAAARLVSPHSQVQQINHRYSDPGSPISGAVIHPPSPDPGLGSSRHVDENTPEHQAPPSPVSPPFESLENNSITSGSKLTATTSAGSSGFPKVSFAGVKSEGFLKRSKTTGKRTGQPPPPLKLSERPLADTYVKTPFPTLAVPPLQRGYSSPHPRSSQQKKGAAEDKDDQTSIKMLKKRNRVSSLPGLGFARSLRIGHFQSGGNETQAAASLQGEGTTTAREGRASPVPKVKSFLSKAKQGLGHGLGIGIGSSEEARKEKRRAEMKKQVRLGEPRP